MDLWQILNLQLSFLSFTCQTLKILGGVHAGVWRHTQACDASINDLKYRIGVLSFQKNLIILVVVRSDVS